MAFTGNGKVERHSFGIKNVSEHTKVSQSVAAHDYLQRRAVMEHHDQIDRSMDRSEKEYAVKEQMARTARRTLTESSIPAVVDRLYHAGKEIIFKEILFEMFTKSLYIDEWFVLEQADNLRAVVNKYVDDNKGYALLEASYQRTKSPYLKEMMKVCEAVAGKACKRKMKQLREGDASVDDISFDLDDEEKGDLDVGKKSLSVDELSDLVKQKVLTVVQDEKARQQKEEEVLSELEEKVSASGTTDVQESIRRATVKGNIVEESTLFDSLFRSSYKEALESITSIEPGNADDQDDPQDMFVNTDEDDIQKDEFQPATKDDIDDGEYTLDDEINEYKTDDDDDNEEDLENIEDEESDDEEDGVGELKGGELDMEMILAESVTKYTLMELAYSIQLEDYSVETVQKISQRLLN